MKKLLLCLLTLSISFAQASDSTLTWQQWKKTWAVYKPNDNFISLQTNDLIRSIDVLDMRSDTSLLGLYTNSSQKPETIKSDVSLAHLFQQKLANNTTGLQLLFVVKHFWINEANTTVFIDKHTNLGAGPNDLTTIRNAHTQAVSSTKMKCTIDAFVKREDSYSTLVRIDTLLTNPKRLSSTTEHMINMAIDAISNKVSGSIQMGNYKTRKPVSNETITNSYSSIFNLPFLKNTDLKKGVYFTWEQFKNNQPENVDFLIQKNDKEPATLYLKDENGKETLSRNVFALCDGKKIFKVQDGYVFEIFCDGRSIYWMGIERQDVKSRSVPLLLPGPGFATFGTESLGAKIKILLTPYLMNLETGQEY